MPPGARKTKTKIARAVDDLAGDIRSINKSVFENPELCYQEIFATKLVTNYLKPLGFKVESDVAGLKTAFKAHRKGKSPGPNIALIAEYDALPNLGHACGHSMIAASACVAAAAIVKGAPDYAGSLWVIGTPAEEGGGGKIKMIDKNAFKNIDVAIMIHPSNKTRVVCRMYAIADYEFTFLGKAAHAAAFPDKGVNALDAGVLFYSSISALRQQMKDEARVHGIFTSGGDAPNIIPEKVVMRYFVRALHTGYFEELKKSVLDCARGAAKATGCKVKIKKIGDEYAPFYPNYPMGDAFRRNMDDLGIKEEGFGEIEEIGSSDIGNLSQALPSLHPEYAIGCKGDINHSRDFLGAVMSKKGERAMTGMTKAMAMTVYDLLSSPELVKNVKEDFKKRMKGRK
ncbi:N-acyl-L-amino acid amidohydrolase [hydrothermal vent metagenome]|uniref:N-acyl-L-amino acid amidohydrolase n=1 Tax=hydrothermal vent metagenome TaxID=652676 RepID=A0A3B1CMZ8_9ZZZZ